MKLGPVTKLGSEKQRLQKKIDDNVMSANFDVMSLNFTSYPSPLQNGPLKSQLRLVLSVKYTPTFIERRFIGNVVVQGSYLLHSFRVKS